MKKKGYFLSKVAFFVLQKLHKKLKKQKKFIIKNLTKTNLNKIIDFLSI